MTNVECCLLPYENSGVATKTQKLKATQSPGLLPKGSYQPLLLHLHH